MVQFQIHAEAHECRTKTKAKQWKKESKWTHLFMLVLCATTKYALKYATSPFNEHIDRLFFKTASTLLFSRRFCSSLLLILFIFFVVFFPHNVSCSHFNALSSSTDWSIFGVFSVEKIRIVFRYCGDSVEFFIFHVSACVRAYERVSRFNFRSHLTIKQMSIQRNVTMCKSETQMRHNYQL